MRRLGKNHDGYHGETIDIHAVLSDVEAAAQQHGWTRETFFESGGLELFALHRAASAVHASQPARRVYISTGIHGDEPGGPLAARQLLRGDRWPANVEAWLCPCLNPDGFVRNRRENAKGIDLNRQYRTPVAEEVAAHIAWLERKPTFDLCLLLHEDWESHGFYLYEQNPDQQESPAEAMIARIAEVCPIDRSAEIEDRPARDGIIRPNIAMYARPDWPEAFHMITHKTRLSYTLEGPSDFPLPTRVAALTAGVNTALEWLAGAMVESRRTDPDQAPAA